MLFPEVQAVCQASRLHIILASERKSRSLNACDGRNKTKQDSWFIVAHATINNANHFCFICWAIKGH